MTALLIVSTVLNAGFYVAGQLQWKRAGRILDEAREMLSKSEQLDAEAVALVKSQCCGKYDVCWHCEVGHG